jgi:hypothetical protein
MYTLRSVSTRIATCTSAVLVLIACSGDTVTVLPAPAPPTGDGGAGGADEPEPEEPLFVVGHTLYSDEGATSYLTVVPSLTDEATIDLTGSLELGGVSSPKGVPGTGVVYVTSSENGTMTEVTIDEDGRPTLGRSVSFANLGISDTYGAHVFLSPTKAYHVNQQTLDVVVWNPEEMTLTGSFSSELAVRDGYDSIVFPQEPILQGDRLLLVSSQWDGSVPDDAAGITVIDAVNDRVLSSDLEPRCASLLAFAPDAEGDLYFISSSLAATGHWWLPERVPAPCMLRIRAGESAFDPGWSRSLTEELGTSLWTGIAPGSDGSLLVQAIAEDNPSVVAAEDLVSMSNATGWTWYELADGDAPPRTIDSPVAIAQYATVMTVDGRSFMTADASGDSILVETTAAGGPRRTLTVPGYVWNVLRVR